MINKQQVISKKIRNYVYRTMATYVLLSMSVALILIYDIAFAYSKFIQDYTGSKELFNILNNFSVITIVIISMSVITAICILPRRKDKMALFLQSKEEYKQILINSKSSRLWREVAFYAINNKTNDVYCKLAKKYFFYKYNANYNALKISLVQKEYSLFVDLLLDHIDNIASVSTYKKAADISRKYIDLDISRSVIHEQNKTVIYFYITTIASFLSTILQSFISNDMEYALGFRVVILGFHVLILTAFSVHSAKKNNYSLYPIEPEEIYTDTLRDSMEKDRQKHQKKNIENNSESSPTNNSNNIIITE